MVPTVSLQGSPIEFGAETCENNDNVACYESHNDAFQDGKYDSMVLMLNNIYEYNNWRGGY